MLKKRFVGYKEKKVEIFGVQVWIDNKGVPRVRWEYLPLDTYTKEGTPIDFLESGISCPEVHEYFAGYVNEQGYNDE